jgi:hypothetical protein
MSESLRAFEGSHKTNKSLYKSSLATQEESNTTFFSSGPPQDTRNKKEKKEFIM